MSAAYLAGDEPSHSVIVFGAGGGGNATGVLVPPNSLSAHARYLLGVSEPSSEGQHAPTLQ